MSAFSYQENIETQFLRHLRPQFTINSRTSSECLFIRLLLGTLRVTNTLSTDSFDQNENYSVLGRPTNPSISTRIIREALAPDCKLEKLCEYLDASIRINNPFYVNLLEEVSSYFYKASKQSHTTGFLHLYRTLEFISYSFPLIYASISRDYYGSFNKLKNYFDSSKNELLFFDEFTKKLIDPGQLETPLTFNFNTLSPTVNRNHFNIVRSLLTDERIDNQVRNISITTTYQHLLQLTIDLRNRYFHFAVGGQRNIRSTEIVENDVFFTIINEELLNWISIIYFEILKASVNKI